MLRRVYALPPPSRSPSGPPSRLLDRWLAQRERPRHAYLLALLAVAGTTALSFAVFPLFPGDNLENLIMLYLLAALLVALRLGRGPGIVASVSSVALFIYFFVPHHYSVILADLEYLPTFVIMLAVSLLVSTLTARLRGELLATEARERRTKAMYELSRDLASVETKRDLAQIVDASTRRALGCHGSVLERTGDELRSLESSQPLPTDVLAAARQTLRHRETRIVGGHSLHALVVVNEVVGVLVCAGLQQESFSSNDEHQLLQSFAHNVAVTLHRMVVAEEVAQARVRADEERLRNVMLSSVSHDLRTPLASITGAVTTLIDSGARLDEPTRADLMLAIRDDAAALERQVRNMLDLTRLESGTLRIRADWHSLEEVVGCALARVESQVADRQVITEIPPDLPLVHVDAMLIEQLLVNLIENAVRYTPPRSPITIGARVDGELLELVVADRGPGIPRDEQERVFAKFYRGASPRQQPGSGLGLAICRAIAQLHQGTITVADRDGGGARFLVRLPTGGAGPTHPEELELPAEKRP